MAGQERFQDLAHQMNNFKLYATKFTAYGIGTNI